MLEHLQPSPQGQFPFTSSNPTANYLVGCLVVHNLFVCICWNRLCAAIRSFGSPAGEIIAAQQSFFLGRGGQLEVGFFSDLPSGKLCYLPNWLRNRKFSKRGCQKTSWFSSLLPTPSWALSLLPFQMRSSEALLHLLIAWKTGRKGALCFCNAYIKNKKSIISPCSYFWGGGLNENLTPSLPPFSS